MTVATLALLALAGGCAAPAARSSATPNATPNAIVAPAVKASAGPASAASGPASAAAPATPPAARPDPTAPKPFAEVIKDAQRDDGFIPVWRKDDKVWLEIAPERLGQLLLVTVNIATSVGERGLYGSQMGPGWLAEFRRVGTQMQLVARQTGFRAERDPAIARAVREAFSDSLIGNTAVASAAHPERKSVLIDASFLLGDLAGYSTRLEQAYRLPFAVDRSNSYFESIRSEPGLTTLSGRVHYSVPRIPAPPVAVPGAPPAPPRAAPPSTTPDPRSLFVGFVYSLRELPAQAMSPRRADPRVGYFLDSYTDLSDDLQPNPRVHHVQRWRLEKKDPQAALSEPVTPVTFWLDRNIPVRYRATVEAGVLEWNRAFERIGFSNAIAVRQQPDDANFDTMDAGHASVRWFVGADVGFAIGPRRSDPRTGEILDADIGMSDVFGRGGRRVFREDMGAATPAWRSGLDTLWAQAQAHGDACSYAEGAASEMHFALDLLEARGDLDPESPETDAFVQAYIRAVVIHEVGHALGLRHNFKASTTVSGEQLKDKAFGAERGISGSVMDYNALNLALPGEPQGAYTMLTLGPYDHWAIEYAYRPLPADQEAAELQKIAARSAGDPALAFADDADAGSGEAAGLDPLANRFDLGDDPLVWYQRRFALSKELWRRVQARGPQAGDDPERLRRSVLAGFRQLSTLPELAAKYVGGMYTERDLPGTGRPTFRPVAPAQQREALRFLTDSLFRIDSFRFEPEFLASLSPDFREPTRAGPVGVAETVLRLQTQAMDRLLAPGTAARLLELPNYLPAAERRGAITLYEVYATLQAAVWSELQDGREIEPLRRGLQRAHLARLQALLTRPQPALPADALSLARLQATRLQADLRKALARPGMAVENRAHLQDSLGLLSEALRATMQRS